MTGKQERELCSLRERLGITEPLDSELSTVAASEMLTDHWSRFRAQQRPRWASHAERSRRGYDEARAWALSVGFSEDQASFAAVRAAMLKGWDGQRSVTKRQVYDGCAQRYPELFSARVVVA